MTMPRDWGIIQFDTAHEINSAETAQHVVINETRTRFLQSTVPPPLSSDVVNISKSCTSTAIFPPGAAPELHTGLIVLILWSKGSQTCLGANFSQSPERANLEAWPHRHRKLDRLPFCCLVFLRIQTHNKECKYRCSGVHFRSETAFL